MRAHMLKYHVLLPAAVFAVLIAAGMPVSTALGLGIAAGCLSMVLMMTTGGHRRHHHVPGDGAAKPAPTRDDPQHTAGPR